jgi:OmpA family
MAQRAEVYLVDFSVRRIESAVCRRSAVQRSIHSVGAALGAVVFLAGGVSARAELTCTGDPLILACFEAYETGLRSFHGPQLDAIADLIAASRAWRMPIDQVTVIGHAALFKSTDPVEENSRKRAETVANALSERLDARGIRGVRIEQARLGGTVPRATNQTREGRALNRRAEVFLDHRRSLDRREAALREVCSERKGTAEVRSLLGIKIPCLDDEQARAICEAYVTPGEGGRLEGAACLPLDVRCVVCQLP